MYVDNVLWIYNACFEFVLKCVAYFMFFVLFFGLCSSLFLWN